MRSLASALAAAALAVAACERSADPGGEATAPASARAPSASAAPSAPPEPQRPWFEGTWAGEATTTRRAMTLDEKQGAPAEWTDDGPPTRGVGAVKLSIDVDGQGVATGSGGGALGNVRFAGVVEGDVLKARVLSIDASGLSGTLVAERSGEALKGTLEAASGDSLIVVHAPVELGKAP